MLYAKKRFVKISTTLFLLMFTLSAFGATRTAIKSKEYKLLLKPSFFKVPNKDYRKFWAIITHVAKTSGLEIKEKEKQYDPRMICFLDTKEFTINKKAFILRVRADKIETANNWINGFNGAELTLKYRSPDLASSIIAPVLAAKDLDGEISMEEDKSFKLGNISSVFSKSGKIFDPNSVPMAVKEIYRYFPGIKIAALDETEKLRIVNNTMIVEKRIRPGYIYIGGEKIKTLFSIWYQKGAKEPFIAEFSFKIKSSTKNKKEELLRSFTAEKEADKFFMKLAEKGKHFLNSKQTKTGLVYSQVK